MHIYKIQQLRLLDAVGVVMEEMFKMMEHVHLAHGINIKIILQETV